MTIHAKSVSGNCQEMSIVSFFVQMPIALNPGIVGSLPARDSRWRAICQVRQLILYSHRSSKASPTNFSQPMLKLCDRN
ncbi:hypothetical protein [Microcoleus sp. Pol12A5]|uniref:hypothetical protein n=1 Tax=Microcoleus sp. Pol12A5 TaxID=3055392 RepID=UPI002FD56CCA